MRSNRSTREAQVSPGPDPERDRRLNGPNLSVFPKYSIESKRKPSPGREAKQATAGDEESGVVAFRIDLDRRIQSM
jgi:hypothetical protein